MNKKNIFIMLYVLLGVIVLGVGYAFITNVSTKITGQASAEATDSDFQVGFDSNMPPSKSSGVESAIVQSPTSASMNVSLDSTTTTATAVFTVRNSSEQLRAKLAVLISSTDEATDKYFAITPIITNSLLSAGSSTTISVKVDLKKLPVTDVKGNFTITLVAKPTE